MIIRVIDFETCGLTPVDGGVVEVGWVNVPSDCIDDNEPFAVLINPGRPIPVEARAVHHISDDMVSGSVDWKTICGDFERCPPDVYCAHNAKFERQWFTGDDLPWICTLKVARRLWPECPSHSNQCLRYYLDLALDPALAMPPHRAGPDAYVTANILVRALDEFDVDYLIELSSQPSLLPRINFGKYKGAYWSQVPDDYLEWLLRQKDMDEDVVFTAQHHLKARAF